MVTDCRRYFYVTRFSEHCIPINVVYVELNYLYSFSLYSRYSGLITLSVQSIKSQCAWRLFLETNKSSLYHYAFVIQYGLIIADEQILINSVSALITFFISFLLSTHFIYWTPGLKSYRGTDRDISTIRPPDSHFDQPYCRWSPLENNRIHTNRVSNVCMDF